MAMSNDLCLLVTVHGVKDSPIRIKHLTFLVSQAIGREVVRSNQYHDLEPPMTVEFSVLDNDTVAVDADALLALQKKAGLKV